MPKLQALIDDIQEQLDINEDDLDLEIQRQPSKFSYWGSQFAKAAKRTARNKLALKQLEAKVGKDFRTFMKKHEPQTRVTEGMVSTFVTLDEGCRAQSQRVIDAQFEEDVLSSAKEAFRQRAQMLLQLGRLKMDEMIQSDFSIGKKELEERTKEWEVKKDAGRTRQNKGKNSRT